MKKILLSTILSLFLLTGVAYAGWTSATVLDGVTSTGASTDFDVQLWEDKTFYIVASSVTSGGTVLVQTSPDGSNWVTIATVAVSANGTSEVAVTGMFHRYIRANLSARTDGTYSVIMFLNQ